MKTIKVFGRTYNLSMECGICHKISLTPVCQSCRERIMAEATEPSLVRDPVLVALGKTNQQAPAPASTENYCSLCAHSWHSAVANTLMCKIPIIFHDQEFIQSPSKPRDVQCALARAMHVAVAAGDRIMMDTPNTRYDDSIQAKYNVPTPVCPKYSPKHGAEEPMPRRNLNPPHIRLNARLQSLMTGEDMTPLTEEEREVFYWISGQQQTRRRVINTNADRPDLPKSMEYIYTTWPFRYTVIDVDFQHNIHGTLVRAGTCTVRCDNCFRTAKIQQQTLLRKKDGWACKHCVNWIKDRQHGTFRVALGYKDLPPCRCATCKQFLSDYRKRHRPIKSGQSQKTTGPADFTNQE